MLFAMHCSQGDWRPAKHLWFLADHLMKVVSGEITRLAISLPPQHGKSQLISKYFPSWLLGRYPKTRVLQCSYSQDLTIEWTGHGRDTIAEFGPSVFGVDTWVRSKKTAWDIWKDGVKTGGSCRGVGARGAITGRPVDFGLLDDVVKGREEVENATLRNQVHSWFRSAVLPRAKRLIHVGTRWHHDDLVGRLKKMQEQGEIGHPWTFINIPAIAEEDDPLGRAVGEVLWPENPLIPPGMRPEEWYEMQRKDVGPYEWSALYQGRPTPIEGGMFQRSWIREYDLIGDSIIRHPSFGECRVEDLRCFGTCDLSSSYSTRADYTALCCWAFHPGWQVLFLLEVVRGHIPGPNIVPTFRAAIDKWKLRKVYVEKANYQLAAIQQIKKAQSAGLPVGEILPEGDKVARAMPMTAALEGGVMLLPRNKSWRIDFDEELLAFPDWVHDDQVDAAAYGVIIANKFRRIQGRGGSRQTKRERDQDPDRWIT